MSKNEHLNLNHSVFLWFDFFVRNCFESVKGNKVLVPVTGCKLKGSSTQARTVVLEPCFRNTEEHVDSC